MSVGIVNVEALTSSSVGCTGCGTGAGFLDGAFGVEGEEVGEYPVADAGSRQRKQYGFFFLAQVASSSS